MKIPEKCLRTLQAVEKRRPRSSRELAIALDILMYDHAIMRRKQNEKTAKLDRRTNKKKKKNRMIGLKRAFFSLALPNCSQTEQRTQSKKGDRPTLQPTQMLIFAPSWLSTFEATRTQSEKETGPRTKRDSPEGFHQKIARNNSCPENLLLLSPG